MMSPTGSVAVPNSVGAPSPLGGATNGTGPSMFAAGSQSSWTVTPTVTEGISASPGMETNTSQSEHWYLLLL